MEKKKTYYVCGWDNYSGTFSKRVMQLSKEEAKEYSRKGYSVFDNSRDADMYELYRACD